MESRTRVFAAVKFEIPTIQEAFNNFFSELESYSIRSLEERSLIVENSRGKLTFSDREGFFAEYEKEDTEYALLESGPKNDNNNAFILEYKKPNTSIEIRLPNMGAVNRVFNEFENFLLTNRDAISNLSTEELEEFLLNEEDTQDDEPLTDTDEEPFIFDESSYTEETINEELSIGLRALADNDEEDLLGYKDYANALADFISSEKTTKPITIGIDAEWGIGKTTLMKQIRLGLVEKTEIKSFWKFKRKIKPKRNFFTVWFNAWKYDGEESLWAALSLEILSQIQEQLNVWERLVLWCKLNYKRFDIRAFFELLVTRLVSLVILAIVSGSIIFVTIVVFFDDVTFKSLFDKVIQYPAQIGLLATFTYIVSIYVGYRQLLPMLPNLRINEYLKKPDYKSKIGFLAEFERDFELLVGIVTQNGKHPLVVFIDDLDRCEPPKPAQIFEAINVLLDAKYCVFIIGMDSNAVAASIESKYEELKSISADAEGLTLGQKFIEKIVQINFRIPKIQEHLIESFVQSNLTSRRNETERNRSEEKIAFVKQRVQAEQRDGKTFEEAFEQVKSENSDLSSQEIEEVKQDAYVTQFDDSKEIETAILRVASILNYNPRRIKRFINLFRLKAYIANRRGMLRDRNIKLKTLAELVAFEMVWPNIIDRFLEDDNFALELSSYLFLMYRVNNEPNNIVAKQELERRRQSMQLENLEYDEKLHRLVRYLSQTPDERRAYSYLGNWSEFPL